MLTRCVVLRGLTIKGSLVGTREDLKEALDFAARGKVRPQVDVRPVSDIHTVFTQLRNGQVSGRIVLDYTPVE